MCIRDRICFIYTALFMKGSPPGSNCLSRSCDTERFLVIPIVNNTRVERYRASCNGRLVLVVNRKQFALDSIVSKRPASVMKSATFSITVFAFVNNAV